MIAREAFKHFAGVEHGDTFVRGALIASRARTALRALRGPGAHKGLKAFTALRALGLLKALQALGTRRALTTWRNVYSSWRKYST